MRLAVVGAGPMGRLHARAISRRAARQGDCVLARVVDRNLERGERVAAEFGGRAADTLDACLDQVDAAVVAVPTRSHGGVTRTFLERGVDVLVEKPIFATAGEAREIVQLALDRGCILSVGHVEWFNAKLRDALRRAGTPRRIEVERLNPRSDRGLDIDVVQDFMIHDLDWVSRSMRDDVVEVTARGRAVSNEALDEVVADLRFATGSCARLYASRVHSKRVRTVRIEGNEATVEVDLLAAAEIDARDRGGFRDEEIEPLDAEWADFLAACRSREAPENDGAVGVAAIEMVERVRRAVTQSAEGSGHGDDPAVRG